jgi:RluA family pseudouridine synthase
MDEKQSFRYRVSPSERGMRLLAFLREKKGEGTSVKSLKRAIESKLCTINGKVECFSSHILDAGDWVECKNDPLPKKLIAPEILYEDEDLLICNKPAGLISTNEAFLAALQRKNLELIHRLDKETSGVILLAKTQEMKKEMVALFSKKEVHKKYLALVAGSVASKEGKVENFLSKKHSYQGQSVFGASKEGEYALTHWRCVKKNSAASLLLCIPVTGRTHQIRVHLSEMGFPIIGDFQYGKEVVFPIVSKRHLLHALEISFIHPRTQKEIKVQVDPPEDFRTIQEKLF